MINNVKNTVSRLALVTGALFFGGYCNAQKLTVALNLGKVIPVNAFSFHDETKGINGFKTTTSQGGTVAIGVDLGYTLNKRFSMGIAPQFIYNRAHMEISFSNGSGGGSLTRVTQAYQTMVIPYCIGYHIDLFKKNIPLKVIGGISYTRYGLVGEGLSTEGGAGGSSTPSGSGIEANNSFNSTSTLGYILGLETYPIKGFSRFGFYIRYYGSFGSGAFNTKAPQNGFQASFSNGTTTQVFNQSFSYRPSNLVVGIAYKFNIVK
jgi:hypothetical protein